jgi:hypothetical protein
VNKEGKEETNEHFGRGDEKKTDNTSAWPIRHWYNEWLGRFPSQDFITSYCKFIWCRWSSSSGENSPTVIWKKKETIEKRSVLFFRLSVSETCCKYKFNSHYHSTYVYRFLFEGMYINTATHMRAMRYITNR